ncbi:hypothetical protein FA15DRAFT_676298 [Coprinopsis marcescibilis]|uniref:Uncharacterized protein n=1 Tax=Coprinopsis marcescibilis TaxID=230819 RepID=A0A5C3KAM3_COPMA|nr:hypothetical protein FA15DRAFT_676298 [Coprinopsis marcescibilis]
MMNILSHKQFNLVDWYRKRLTRAMTKLEEALLSPIHEDSIFGSLFEPMNPVEALLAKIIDDLAETMQIANNLQVQDVHNRHFNETCPLSRMLNVQSRNLW